jgi:hypothetical protein
MAAKQSMTGFAETGAWPTPVEIRTTVTRHD